jgi:hypothetical protein
MAKCTITSIVFVRIRYIRGGTKACRLSINVSIARENKLHIGYNRLVIAIVYVYLEHEKLDTFPPVNVDQ